VCVELICGVCLYFWFSKQFLACSVVYIVEFVVVAVQSS